MIEELYQEVILDHYKKPRCHGCINNPGATAQLYNPLCGDKINLTLNLDGEKISEIKFSGHGCSISQASASIMSSLCEGKSVSRALELNELFKRMMRGEKDPKDYDDLGDGIALEGVRKFSARVKCAVLAWEALEKCLEKPVPQ